MNLHDIPKRAWRARVLESYYSVSKNDFVPRDEVFFTLGGPARQRYSEYSYLTSVPTSNPGRCDRFILPNQYVSVEQNLGIHRSNARIKGPTWLRGEFSDCLFLWGATHKVPVAVYSCDLMCGIVKALPTIQKTLAFAWGRCRWHRYGLRAIAPRCGQQLLVFNVCSRRRLHPPNANFPPVWKTIKEDAVFKFMHTRGLTVVDHFDYANKAVGQGADNTHMETFVFAL